MRDRQSAPVPVPDSDTTPVRDAQAGDGMCESPPHESGAPKADAPVCADVASASPRGETRAGSPSYAVAGRGLARAESAGETADGQTAAAPDDDSAHAPDSEAAQVEDAVLASLGSALVQMWRRLWPRAADADAGADAKAGAEVASPVRDADADAEVASPDRVAQVTHHRPRSGSEGGDDDAHGADAGEAASPVRDTEVETVADADAEAEAGDDMRESPPHVDGARESAEGAEDGQEARAPEAPEAEQESDTQPQIETVTPGRPQSLPGQIGSANLHRPHSRGTEIWKGVL